VAAALELRRGKAVGRLARWRVTSSRLRIQQRADQIRQCLEQGMEPLVGFHGGDSARAPEQGHKVPSAAGSDSPGTLNVQIMRWDHMICTIALDHCQGHVD
jgi:hypothetical protein